MFQSTRRRLTLWYATITAILLLVLASGVYGYVRATLIERIDDTLNHVVEVVERSLVIEPAEDGLVWMLDGRVSQRVNVEASFRNNALFRNDDDRIDLEWFSAQGELQWSTFNIPLPLSLPFPLTVSHREETVHIAPKELPEKRPEQSLDRDYPKPLVLRQLTERVEIGRQVLGYLRVSHPWFEVTKPTRQLVADLAIGLVVLVLVVGAIGWLLSGLAMRPVQESYQRLKQFTADASHELRTPIAIIQANVQLALSELEESEKLGISEKLGKLGELQESEESEAASTKTSFKLHFQRVERLTRRLGRLVDDLLFLARQDSGIVQPYWSTIDLEQLLLETIEDYEIMATEQKVQLGLALTDSPENQTFHLQGDRDQLTRLISNLMHNALQHTPPGGTITLRLEEPTEIVVRGKNHAALAFSVIDTGSGIAHTELPHIFHRFYRSDPARDRSTGDGAGLGLAIVQAIVQTHQGQIKVHSQIDQGSEFRVILPTRIGL